MYLSRLILNPRGRAVRRDLAGHQDLHRTVLSLFPQLPQDVPPGTDARQHFGVLHRVDTDQPTGRVTLLVQSRAAPDFSRLPPEYLLSPAGSVPNPHCKSVADPYKAIQPGMRLAFRLRANPTRKIDTKSGPDGRRRNGKRVDLRTDEERTGWLSRKAVEAGFRLVEVRTHRPIEGLLAGSGSVPDVNVAVEARLWGRRGGAERRARSKDSRGNPLTFASVLFEGVLEVTDPDRLRDALAHGIGSGKAYGFGLLSVAPVAAATV
jgi:CRISPR system Cascade subunit CasE